MLDHLHDESDPRRRRLIALGLHVRERTSKVPEEAAALDSIERERV